MSDFHFELTDEEKGYLKKLVAASITSRLNPGVGPDAPDKPPTDTLREHLGAFVTLKIGGHLRGCIGNVQGQGELYRTVWDMARSAAFSDPRFPPVSADEYPALDVEISILSPLTVCTDPEKIEVGRHGLVVVTPSRSGLLLPQVPVEWGWDRMIFLRQTCRKAGLPDSAWQDPGTTLLWFEAVVF